MQRFRITDRIRGSVEVEAANWMSALGEGLARLGIDPQLDRISAEALPSGQMFVRDVRTGAAYAVLPLETVGDHTEEVDLSEEIVVADVAPASAVDEAEEIRHAPTREHALYQALDAARALVPCEGGSILLVQPDGTLSFTVATGPGSENLVGVSLPAGTGIAGFCVNRSTTVALKEAYADPRFFAQVDTVTGTRTKSLLCVPVAAAGRVLGCLELINALDAGGFSRAAMADTCLVADALAARLSEPA
ncbi:MAG: hypothetical protein RLZZ299_1653 [Pseudomonadota bacterium]